MSTYGSPYAFYTVDLSYSNRTETSVVVSYKITSRLQYEASWMGYALTAYLTVGGKSSGAIALKGNESWSGTANHTVSGSFTVTGLSATTSSLSTSFSVSSSSPDYACQLSATSGSALSISIYGKKTIPTLSESNVNLGNAVTINLGSRLLSSYTHTLTYSFGSIFGNIVTKTASSTVSFTPPLSLAAQIPSAMSGEMTIKCTTYTSSGTSLGDYSIKLTVHVPSSAATTPSLSKSSADLGQPIDIYLASRLSSEYTHTLSFAFGDINETICTNTTSTFLEFIPELMLAKEIPDELSGTAIITCDTYNTAGVLVGSTSVNLTLNVPEEAKTIPVLMSETIYLGQKLSVDLSNKLVDSYTHSISYEFEGETQNVEHEPLDEAVVVDFPIELANKLVDSEYGNVKILCQTYNGSGLLVGAYSIPIEVRVPEEILPSIEDVVIDEAVIKVKEDFGLYTSTLSKLTVEISAEGSYGSYIKSYSTSVEGVNYVGRQFTSDIIKNPGVLEVKTTVIDSRGRTAYLVREVEVIPYQEPTVDMELNLNGENMTVLLIGRVAPVNGNNCKALKLKYRIAGEETYFEEEVDIDEEDWNFEIIHTPQTYDSEATWEFVAELFDKNTIKSTSMLTGKTVLSRRAGGTGIAFGKEATQEGFDCNWDATFRGNTSFEGNITFAGKTFWDKCYPIGTYFWSSINTNPAEYFGGVWEQVKDRFILAAGDSYGAGGIGGSATVCLTTDNMPSHTHLVSATASTQDNHTHSVSGNTSTTGSHTHTSQGYWAAGSGNSHAIARKTVSGDPTDTNSLNYAGSHYHSFSVTSGGGGSHTHTITATAENSGSGVAHENMPPYEVAYCWRRIA